MSQNKAATTTPKKGKTSSSKEEVIEEEKVPRPTPQEIRKAAFCLAQAYAMDERPDPDLPVTDITLDVNITMRVGPGNPLIIHERRTLRDILNDPGVVSAPQEFEVVIKQILMPLFKSVQRETSRLMEINSQGFDTSDEFRPTLPSP